MFYITLGNNSARSGMKTGQARRIKDFKLINKTNRHTMKSARGASETDVVVSMERKSDPQLATVINETRPKSIFNTAAKQRELSVGSENYRSNNPSKRSSVKVLPKNTLK